MLPAVAHCYVSAKNYRLDMDDFTRTVDRLGHDAVAPGFSKIALAVTQPLSRDPTRLTHLTTAAAKAPLATSALNNAAASRVAQCGSAKAPQREVTPIWHQLLFA